MTLTNNRKSKRKNYRHVAVASETAHVAPSAALGNLH
jgi:hypothetical protein